MKTIFNLKQTVPAIISLIAVIFFSCKKDAVTTSTQLNSDQNVSLSIDQTGVTTLIIKPDTKDGQDTYVSKIDNNPDDGNVNQNWTHEIAIAKWIEYFSQSPATWRGYIKFDSLSKIP